MGCIWRQHPIGNSALLRATGLFIKLQSVLGGYLHASVRLVPRNQARWANYGPFNETSNPPFNSPPPLDGRKWTTVGAGPSDADTSWTCDGNLISNFNRSGDVSAFPVRFERLNYPQNMEVEDRLINAILNSDANYDDNLPYACFPNEGDHYYNSNSYIAGLLLKTGFGTPGLAMQLWRSLPGWRKPIPASNFQ